MSESGGEDGAGVALALAAFDEAVARLAAAEEPDTVDAATEATDLLSQLPQRGAAACTSFLRCVSMWGGRLFLRCASCYLYKQRSPVRLARWRTAELQRPGWAAWRSWSSGARATRNLPQTRRACRPELSASTRQPR